MVFIERISEEEFESQKGQFTQDQVKLLQNSYEYRHMRNEKGRALENWNWQAYEAKHGVADDVYEND